VHAPMLACGSAGLKQKPPARMNVIIVAVMVRKLLP